MVHYVMSDVTNTFNYFSDICSPLIIQGGEELAIDVMDRLSASVLESFIHLTGADQVKRIIIRIQNICFMLCLFYET